MTTASLTFPGTIHNVHDHSLAPGVLDPSSESAEVCRAAMGEPRQRTGWMSDPVGLSGWERDVLHALDDHEYRSAANLGQAFSSQASRRIVSSTIRATLQALARRGLVEQAPKRGRAFSWRRTEAGRVACHTAAAEGADH